MQATVQKIPLAFVIDACRSAAPANGGADQKNPDPTCGSEGESPKAGSPSRYAPRGTGYQTRGPVGKTNFLEPTTLYSAVSGKKAADMKGDLIANLAAGLTVERQGFAARLRFGPNAVPNKAADSTLTVLDWFHYAIQQVQNATHLQQACWVDWGHPVGMTCVVAEVQQAKVTAPQKIMQTVDLLSAWRPQFGGFATGEFQNIGRVVTRPLGIAAKEAYADGAVGDPFPTDGRLVMLELAADCPSAGKNRVGTVFFEWHLKCQGEAIMPTYLGVGDLAGNKVFSASSSGLTLHTVALNKNPIGLDRIAFAQPRNGTTWQTGDSITVVSMRLIEPGTGPADQFSHRTAHKDFLGRWWAKDVEEERPMPGKLGKDAATGSSCYRFEPPEGAKGSVPCGGAIDPPIFVPKGYVANLEFANDGKAEVRVEMELSTQATSYSSAPVVLKPGERKKATVTIPNPGFIQYCKIETTGPVQVASGSFSAR